MFERICTMPRAMVLASLLLVFAVSGCAKTAPQEPGDRTLMRCPHCGMEFTVEEGLKAYEQHHAP